MTPALALACWERALAEEIGIIITLEDISQKRAVEKLLYDARQASGNPDLEQLMLAKPGDKPEEMWIVKKATDMSEVAI